MKKCKIFNNSNTRNLEIDFNEWLSNNSVTILSVTQSSGVWAGDLRTIITVIYEERYPVQDTGPR